MGLCIPRTGLLTIRLRYMLRVEPLSLHAADRPCEPGRTVRTGGLVAFQLLERAKSEMRGTERQRPNAPVRPRRSSAGYDGGSFVGPALQILTLGGRDERLRPGP